VTAAPPARRRFAICLVLAIALVLPAAAAELKPPTVAAFERYQSAAEAAIARDIAKPETFLRVLRGDAAARQRVLATLRRGEVAIERLRATEQGKIVDVPDGLIHHWVGAIFMPNVTVDKAVALLQDYDRHANVFAPAVQRSKLLERNGDRFRLYLRFYMKKVIAVTVNTESAAEFTRHDTQHVTSLIRSTRIAEVENPGTPSERELPIGRDGGYLWRLNTYWRFLERDGGTYVECESITLTRAIPFGLGWAIGPFITSIPRDTLTATLTATRKELLR
jgi:hypothetical protein